MEKEEGACDSGKLLPPLPVSCSGGKHKIHARFGRSVPQLSVGFLDSFSLYLSALSQRPSYFTNIIPKRNITFNIS